MSPSSRRRLRSLPLLAILTTCLILAGCAGPASSATSQAVSTPGVTQTTPAPTTTQPDDTLPQATFLAYAAAWAGQDYAALYGLLATKARDKIDEEAFVTRYRAIMSGIEAENIRLLHDEPLTPVITTADTAYLLFSVAMDTLAGPVSLSGYEMDLVLETDGGQMVWRVDWTEQLIFPTMQPDDKVRARILAPRRGEIRDRNQQGLAINGELVVIGIAPKKFLPGQVEAIPQLASLLGISEERIRKVVNAASNPDWFYPLVTLPADARDLAAQLTAIPGVQYQKTEGRIYPAGAAAGLLTGYVGPITAEELAKHGDKGYSATDKIGKMGLEQVYEARLRGVKGGEITLVQGESGQIRDVIARQEAIDGENITVSIDTSVQASLFNSMAANAGAGAAVNPQTGEILALVSTPSFDPNLFQTYVPDTVQKSWNDAVKSSFANRFKAGYAPGSVFKLVTAAIGLKTGLLDPAEALTISGLKWQPDASWGEYRVTRVKDIGRPVNLQDALIYSDNIYFARQALKIGRERFEAGAADFGIGTDLPIDYPFVRAQLSNTGLTRDVLVADTGYGQGEVLVSPLHIALFYSALATQGDIMQPVLELRGAVLPQVWQAQAIASRHVPVLTAALLQVVENPAGSGYTRTVYRTRILGKTGTAELKKSLDDTGAQENGWFVAMNVDTPRLTIAMIIEDVKGRGGSHLVVPLVKQAMDEILSPP